MKKLLRIGTVLFVLTALATLVIMRAPAQAGTSSAPPQAGGCC